MRLRVEGRFRVVTLATGLPLLKVVTVTLETCGFFAAAFLALGLRVAVLRAVDAVAVGMKCNSFEPFNYTRKGVDKLFNRYTMKQKSPLCELSSKNPAASHGQKKNGLRDRSRIRAFRPCTRRMCH